MTNWAPITLASSDILYADDDLVAVDKAAGVLTDASPDPNRPHLGTALAAWAAANNDATDFMAAHRLDLATSGVVLFARNKPTATALMQQFQQRLVTKRYHAVVTSAGPDWTVGATFDRRSYLRHRRGYSEEVRSGGKPANSHFEVLNRVDDLALIQATPHTGRTHQLRVHLAALGSPIAGDDRYGGAQHTRLWLHAHTLKLTHPTSAKPLSLSSGSVLALADNGPEISLR